MKKPAPRVTQNQRRAQARARQESQAPQQEPEPHPHAAGIDIAVNDDLWVDVGSAGGERPVRSFSPRTPGLRALCAWLRECQVETVAMEATGSYWLSLYLELHQAGFAVVVVNPRSLQHLKRKSDVSDCQWLRYLHSVGLLQSSFVPPEQVLALRTLSRQRENLLQTVGLHTQRLQKAMDEMNLHLHHVISDLMGATGRAVIEAILGGERDPQQLAKLRDHRIKASAQKVAESLEGRWREEQLFVLRQEYESIGVLHRQVASCDEQLLALSQALPARLSAEEQARIETASAPATAKGARGRRRKAQGSKNAPAGSGDWLKLLHRLFGVDLTLTPGVSVLTVLCLVCELGTDWGRSFPSASHFASWLGLCPNHRISGGKVLSRRTWAVQHRVRNQLKLCAQGLWGSQSLLGDQYRRLRARLGPAKANTAMAHKLARLLWHQVVTQCPYEETFLAHLERQRETRAKRQLQQQAAKYGFDLVPRKEAA